MLCHNWHQILSTHILMSKTCLKEHKKHKSQIILPLSSTTLVCSLKQSTGKPITSTSTNGSMIWKTKSNKYWKERVTKMKPKQMAFTIWALYMNVWLIISLEPYGVDYSVDKISFPFFASPRSTVLANGGKSSNHCCDAEKWRKPPEDVECSWPKSYSCSVSPDK